ncbi:hypothetical protein AGMMS49546_14140 [Spirochaetia bacterium]|nr:hypothetical protein AGMMS49546_14140 [Spirochaetia bacterium]
MPDNRKEQERAELHRTIWSIANDLRGSVDGWDFKSYVLGILFYRYISENLSGYINAAEHEAGEAAFDYAKLSDKKAKEARKELVETKGFFILPGELFENVHRKAAGDENLNETLERVFKNIEASAQGTRSEDDFKGLFDDIDVNSNKLGGTVAKRNERLVKLLNGVAEMKLGDYQDNTIDAFGDAYEYLMGMYASNAGKSGGEYYTPQEVSELLTAYTERKNKKHFTKLIPNSKIADQDYNLSVSTYVEQEDKREAVDIKTLNAEIKKIVAREDVLRKEIAAIVKEIEGEGTV